MSLAVCTPDHPYVSIIQVNMLQIFRTKLSNEKLTESNNLAIRGGMVIPLALYTPLVPIQPPTWKPICRTVLVHATDKTMTDGMTEGRMDGQSGYFK